MEKEYKELGDAMKTKKVIAKAKFADKNIYDVGTHEETENLVRKVFEAFTPCS